MYTSHFKLRLRALTVWYMRGKIAPQSKFVQVSPSILVVTTNCQYNVLLGRHLKQIVCFT